MVSGFIENTDNIEDTAIKEVKEKIGINIDVKKIIGSFNTGKFDTRNNLLIGVIAKYKGGKLKADDDIIEAKFFNFENAKIPE